MATNFPESLDTLTNPNSTDQLSYPSHSDQHANANDAIEAIQSVIGVSNSEDSNSITYKINQLSTTVGNIGNSTTSITELIGLDGNNDLTVTGIENKTVVDSFSKSAFRTAEYAIQITRGDLHEAFGSKIMHDDSNIYVTTSNVISNTDLSLAVVTFEENSGMINLCVLPVAGPVTVRYYRTALKI